MAPFATFLALLALFLPPAAAGPAGVSAPPPDPPVRVEREARVMGTRLSVAVDAADRAAGLAASEAALAEIERQERLLSSWDAATPLSRLNRAPVGEVLHADLDLPAELLHLLAEVDELSRRTGGAFDTRLGALVEAWGLRTEPRTPTPDQLDAARSASGPVALEIRTDGSGARRLHPAAWLDSGGFGKGAALRAAADTLRARGVAHAVLDLGGQLQVVGAGASGLGGWSVAVAHPVRREHAVARLLLDDASVATSGFSERGRHILDPRDGRPVEAWGSVTVVADDALVADVLSTALYVLGPDAGMAWLEGRDDVGALFLSVDGSGGLSARWNAAMDRWMTDPPGVSAGLSDIEAAPAPRPRPSDAHITYR